MLNLTKPRCHPERPRDVKSGRLCSPVPPKIYKSFLDLQIIRNHSTQLTTFIIFALGLFGLSGGSTVNITFICASILETRELLANTLK